MRPPPVAAERRSSRPLRDSCTTPKAQKKVQTLTLAYASQRRLVLEAVAFGAFLRQSETYIDGYNPKLLTPTPRASLPNSSSDDDDDGGSRVA